MCDKSRIELKLLEQVWSTEVHLKFLPLKSIEFDLQDQNSFKLAENVNLQRYSYRAYSRQTFPPPLYTLSASLGTKIASLDDVIDMRTLHQFPSNSSVNQSGFTWAVYCNINIVWNALEETSKLFLMWDHFGKPIVLLLQLVSVNKSNVDMSKKFWHVDLFASKWARNLLVPATVICKIQIIIYHAFC